MPHDSWRPWKDGGAHRPGTHAHALIKHTLADNFRHPTSQRVSTSITFSTPTIHNFQKLCLIDITSAHERGIDLNIKTGSLPRGLPVVHLRMALLPRKQSFSPHSWPGSLSIWMPPHYGLFIQPGWNRFARKTDGMSFGISGWHDLLCDGQSKHLLHIGTASACPRMLIRIDYELKENVFQNSKRLSDLNKDIRREFIKKMQIDQAKTRLQKCSFKSIISNKIPIFWYRETIFLVRRIVIIANHTSSTE